MSKKTLAVLAVGVAVIFLFASTGCTAKKHLRTIEEQKAQLDQANSQINELQKGNETLNKSLDDAKSALASAQGENKQLSANAASLKEQLAALENQKSELDKALAAGKESEASYQKKIRGLNGLAANLRTKITEAEAQISAKDSEIAALKAGEAALKAAAEEQSRQMATLNTAKDDLAALMDKTVSGKNQTILILAILLGLAIIAAIIGIVRGRRRSAAV